MVRQERQEKDLEKKEETPPSCHTSAHHTSRKLHAPFHLECGSSTSWMVSLTHSIMFGGCFITCSSYLSTFENGPGLKTYLLGQKHIDTTANQHLEMFFTTQYLFTWESEYCWPLWQLLMRGVEAGIRWHQAQVHQPWDSNVQLVLVANWRSLPHDAVAAQRFTPDWTKNNKTPAI